MPDAWMGADADASLDPMSQIEVEAKIREVSRDLVQVTMDIATLSEEAAVAEHAWRLVRAKEHLACRATALGKATVADIEAQVAVRTEEQHFAHLVAEGKLRAAQEKGRNLRAVLDAMRSVNANVRMVVQG